MKTLLLSATLTLLFAFAYSVTFGQQKKESLVALSFRGGMESIGASAQVRLSGNSSLMMLYASEPANDRQMLNALYTESFRLGNAKGLRWFGGAGIHAGLRKITEADGPEIRNSRNGSDEPREQLFVLGTAAILGLEYRFAELPVRLSLDVKPYVDFMNGQSSIRDIALSAGFCF